MEENSEYRVIQNGLCVAATSGPRTAAFRDALHYLMQYAQDGPCELKEVKRRKKKATGDEE